MGYPEKEMKKQMLLTQKRADFYLFKDSVQLMLNRSHITEEGLKKTKKKIISLKASMNKGLSCSLKAAFPNVVPVPRPLVLNISSVATNWLSGFVDAEGCFYWIYRNLKGTG